MNGWKALAFGLASALLFQGCGAAMGAQCNANSDCRDGLACVDGEPDDEGNATRTCRDDDPPSGESVPEAPIATVSVDPLLDIPEAERCETNDDCVATQFHDCCADNAGRCMCDWHALNREWAEQALLECGVEECADGTCHDCPPTEPARDASCTQHQCGLTPL